MFYHYRRTTYTMIPQTQYVDTGTPPEGEGPLSSPRSDKSVLDFDVAPVPVFCHRKDSDSKERVPAIQAKYPTLGIALFPLNRIELGEIWHGKARLGAWEIKLLSGGWEQAFKAFSKYIKYPPEFLRPTLEALRTQTYLDKSPLKWTQWSFDCKNTSPKLFAVAECRVCGTPRCLSMRLLNEVNRTLDDFQCQSVGTRCGEEGRKNYLYDEYREIPRSKAESSSQREPPPSSKYQSAREPPNDSSHFNSFTHQFDKFPFDPLYEEYSFNRHKTTTTDPLRCTIPLAYKDDSSRHQDYCTWSDVKKKQKKHRRKKNSSDSENSDSEGERDPLNDTLALLHPKNFLMVC